MGVLRFAFDPPDLFDRSPSMRAGYLTGLDGRVYPTRIELHDQIVGFRRSHSDSCKLHLSFPVDGYGRPVLTTASLPEREAPYRLSLELLRGKLGEVRDQAANWEQARMAIPERFRQLHRMAFRALAQASANSTVPADAEVAAQRGLKAACEAADVLMEAYIVQRAASRRASPQQAESLIGVTLDRFILDNPAVAEKIGQSCSSVVVPLEWRLIEASEGNYDWDLFDKMIDWGQGHRKTLIGGPLIDLSESGLPDWLAPWANDFLNLPSFVCDFIETVVSRYTGRIRLWEVAASGNTGGCWSLSEEQRLALVARVLETAYRTDSDAQFFVRVSQPWGEYGLRGQHRLSPQQFVDALIRSNLGLSGVTLELAPGYPQSGSLIRDRLAMSRLIDQWGLLGVPLHVVVAVPSNMGADSFAKYPQIESGPWKKSWSEEAQAEWLGNVVPMLAAKPAVTGVFLSNLWDGAPHRFGHAGLMRADGKPKAAFETMCSLCRR